MHIKNISNRVLLVTINRKITIIRTYAPTEEGSATDRETFYNSLTDCIREVPLHNLVVLLGDLNARIGPSNHILRPLEDTPTIKKPMTMVIDQSIFVKQITRASLQQENLIQADTSGVGNILIAKRYN